MSLSADIARIRADAVNMEGECSRAFLHCQGCERLSPDPHRNERILAKAARRSSTSDPKKHDYRTNVPLIRCLGSRGRSGRQLGPQMLCIAFVQPDRASALLYQGQHGINDRRCDAGKPAKLLHGSH
jgi:hypothetical protein